MKLFRWLLIMLLPLAMASCTDTHENLVIKENGSGTLTIKTDIGKMLEILKSFSGDSSLMQNGLDKVYDTTLQMKDYVDTASGMTSEQKNLFHKGSVHIVVNVKDNIGKFDMSFPFSSAGDLSKLYSGLNGSAGSLKNMMGDMSKNFPNATPDTGKDNGLPQIASVYDISLTPNSYSRKVNQEKYQAFSQMVKPEQLSQVNGMLGGMDYTFSISLPRKVKTVSNTKAVIAEDRKTVLLKADLLDCFQHPEVLELQLTY